MLVDIAIDVADTFLRMLRDAEFFRSRISKLDGAADIGDYLVSIVNSKHVAEKLESAETIPAEPEPTAEKPQEKTLTT